MVVVLLSLNLIDGKNEEFERAFRNLATKVHNDPGVIAFVLNRHTTNTNEYLLYEKYENAEARKYHSSTPHAAEFRNAIGKMLASSPELNVYQEIV